MHVLVFIAREHALKWKSKDFYRILIASLDMRAKHVCKNPKFNFWHHP